MSDYNTYLDYLKHVDQVSVEHISEDKKKLEVLSEENLSLKNNVEQLQSKIADLTKECQKASQRTNETLSVYIDLITELAKLLKIDTSMIVSFIDNKKDLRGLSHYIIQYVQGKISINH